MKIIGVIPARYASSRFPGKPLADICGKPMIWWVYQQAMKVDLFEEVYLATDDERIKKVCDDLDMRVIGTSDSHPTGTDRVGEVAKKIQADLYVNIQGDEPLIEPSTIEKAVLPFLENKDLQVSNLMTEIKNPVDLINNTVPKVITNHKNEAVFLSRTASPYPNGKIDFKYYKQVCVYGFTPWALSFFCDSPRGKVEAVEEIEILRFIENGIKVQYIEVASDTVAVDTPKDLEKVKLIISKKEK